MKKQILILGAVVAVATAAYAVSTQIKQTGAGLQLGTATTQKLSFYGSTPTNQLNVTVTSWDTNTVKSLIDALRIIGLVNTN